MIKTLPKIDLEAFREREAQGLITCRSHPHFDLLIWNYTPKCQWERAWDEVTMQARGLITKPDGTIIALPFKKFFNIDEHIGEIPLEPFKVTEKMDGSLAISYVVDGEVYLATRGSFTSEQAIRATQILHSHYSGFTSFMVHKAYYTYLFEVIYPANRVVVDYGDMEDLVLLAIINRTTGQEYNIHDAIFANLWPFPVVRWYDGIKDIAELKKLEEANKEGFVLHFESGLRLKAKFEEYKRLHKLLTQINAKVIWELLKNNQPFDDLLNRVPDEFYQWVQNTRDSLIAQFREIEEASKQVYEQVKNLQTRKEQAMLVTKMPYAAVVFKMLDNRDYAEVIWKQIKPMAEKPFREDNEG